jgi:hypothetical protein
MTLPKDKTDDDYRVGIHRVESSPLFGASSHRAKPKSMNVFTFDTSIHMIWTGADTA